MNPQVSIDENPGVYIEGGETTPEVVKETTIKNWVKKLTSRKFLMALVPAVAAICALFGYSENQVITIASSAVIVISSIGYMYTEGKCDQASINASMDALKDIIENLTSENNTLKLELAAYEDEHFLEDDDDEEDDETDL